MTITVVLAGPPKGKGRPRFSRKSGVAFTPAETRSYEGALRYAAQQTMGAKSPLEGALDISIVANFPVPESWSKRKKAQALSGELRPTGKPDFDNLAKTVDALNQIVWRDDAQVVESRIRKFYSDRPALIVMVRALDVIEAAPATPSLDFMEL